MTNISALPRVSGIMAARNSAAYIAAAIESALHQTFADFELLIVDDASTDETREIVAGYAGRDSRVRMFRHAECRGPASARNLALGEARGEWIAVLDSDDLWRPRRLERQLAVADTNPSVRLITSDYELMDRQGRRLKTVRCIPSEWLIQWRLLFGNALGGHSQVLFHRETALACGGYRSDLNLAEDYQLWVDLAKRGGIAAVPEVLMDYRLHNHAASAVNPCEQTKRAQQISSQAMTALLGEAWPAERLALLRDFWFEPFPVGGSPLSQIARDIQHLEKAFWERHPESASPANRRGLRLHIRRQWASYGRHLLQKGSGRETLAAWGYALAL